MEFTGKKVLLTIVYYTLIALNLAIAITFMVFLSVSGASLFSVIGYYILTSLFVLLMIYDIICTNVKRMKFVSGLILYVLCVLTVVMAFVVYALTVVNGIVPAGIANIFTALITLSLAIAVIDIVIFSVGQKLIEFETK